MPTTSIDCSQISTILNPQPPSTATPKSPQDPIISSPLGLVIIEIQGELNLPTTVPTNNTEETQEYISENFITVDRIYDAVKFGKIEFDTRDEKKVTLFIGKSQRLIGSIVNLDKPLGVLRVPIKREDDMEEGLEEEDGIKLVDVVRKRMIFKQRPLPIM
ncbi:uncharacterized protein J8A68_002946 [[Candida] subhashii]|uniref:Chromosome transmission fidelity protein 8 n=1 Tax=[Candida] subhashii TaxID=561895 RepID=A0A8J5UXD0_9ASCO|nr:uncharacterized protein J8A68_002946 [[Candida] subhashii]KAG7663560.1 hypothetical protein J8A68_002946 [[Candida] subhashii]